MKAAFVLILVVATMAVVCAKPRVSKFFNELMSFEDAKKRCADIGWQLDLPLSIKENKKLHDKLIKRNVKRMWIGLQGRGDRTNRKWFNMDNVEVKHENTFWGRDEPNDYLHHDERCGEIRDLPKNNYTSNWNDRPCDHLNTFSCRLKTGSFD